jgi:hypothetical protein
MKRKKNVRIGGVQPEMVVAMLLVEPVLDSYNQEMVLTEVTGGMHSETSRHYSGFAFDIRTWQLQEDETVDQCAEKIRDALGKEYRVIVHDTHIHVMFIGLPV